MQSFVHIHNHNYVLCRTEQSHYCSVQQWTPSLYELSNLHHTRHCKTLTIIATKPASNHRDSHQSTKENVQTNLHPRIPMRPSTQVRVRALPRSSPTQALPHTDQLHRRLFPRSTSAVLSPMRRGDETKTAGRLPRREKRDDPDRAREVLDG